ncbi:MAG: alcohol dehydrogenase catalytic domain-containing protein [Thermoleophilia bacterium]|nr:alcohol dehydrogenase catalytic domain-containing protein [Thermoleophilia bacterium]
MKAAVQYGPRDLRVEEVDEPVCGPDEVKVQIAYCGLCGTDPEIYEGTFGLMKTEGWPKGPKIEGHEATGTIVEVGRETRQGYQAGQRVAMNFRASCGACYYCRNKMEHFCEYAAMASGAFAEYAVYKEGAIFPLPEDMSFETASLLEPLSVALHIVDLSDLRSGGSVAILGAGPIGLLALQVAVTSGAARVLVSEPVAEKRALAERLGADATVDPVSGDLAAAAAEMTQGRGFDAVIDASGNMRAAAQALAVAGRGATIVLGAVYPADAELGVRPFDLYARELTLRGCWISPYSFTRSLDLLAKLDVEPLISEIIPLDEIQRAFESHKQGRAIKILIKP